MTINSFPSIEDLLAQQRHQITFSQLRKTQSILFDDFRSNLIFKKIILPAKTLNSHIDIYEWRNTIEKGIVHCLWSCILPLDKKNVLIQLKNKIYQYTLKDIAKTSLTKLIYILKEALIGFQILYNKFGGFQVDDECIFIDQNYQIEVWGSKQPASNIFSLKEQSQHEFVLSILKLLQSHEIRSKLTKKFNEGLQRYQQLTFEILNTYIESFITENQLIIGSQKSVRQILMYPNGIKQLRANQDRNGQKNYSHQFIQNRKNQVMSPKSSLKIVSRINSQKEQNLEFSSSRKLRRKGPHLLSPRSGNALKDSDMTTEGTQNLSGSRDYNIGKEGKSKQKNQVLNFTNKKQSTILQFRYHSNKQLRSSETDPKVFQKQQSHAHQVRMIQKLQISSNKRQDVLDNYTREALSERQNVENQENLSQEKETKMDIKIPYQPQQSQEEQQSQPQIDLMLFKGKLRSNFKIFETIDSLADTKKMTSSIQVEDEKRRKSPIKLQRLSNIKTKLHESIMEEDFLAERLN